uniref:Putative secreted protein n=1 Tax=Ixodes ricinus TaxID=34613 RepID=A0A147BTF8_IXORI
MLVPWPTTSWTTVWRLAWAAWEPRPHCPRSWDSHSLLPSEVRTCPWLSLCSTATLAGPSVLKGSCSTTIS